MARKVTIPDGSPVPLLALVEMGTPELSQHMNQLSGLRQRVTTFTARELEATRIRSAYLMGCQVCVGLRASDFFADPNVASEVTEDFYEHVLDPSWEGFSPREGLILELIERFASDHVALREDDAFWARMHEHFSETEIVDLCLNTVGVGVGLSLMAKVLLDFNEICEIAPPRSGAASTGA
jgi:alkylhydroperoxidase family enzyme